MTREEQIKEASKSVLLSKRLSFQLGAKWADYNPCWHLCKNELPELEKDYLCWNGYCQRVYYFFNGNFYNQDGKQTVIAWMELPKYNL